LGVMIEAPRFKRTHISATIVVDVKRFCRQIKTDGVFGTYSHFIFFKIDYYDKAFTCLSPDLVDPAVTQRVIAIMLAEEY
jgi:hypothetical protein